MYCVLHTKPKEFNDTYMIVVMTVAMMVMMIVVLGRLEQRISNKQKSGGEIVQFLELGT